jgi:cytochrome c-type biogenesis protein CcmH/NrfF
MIAHVETPDGEGATTVVLWPLPPLLVLTGAALVRSGRRGHKSLSLPAVST